MSATGTFFKEEGGEYMEKQLNELSDLVRTQTKMYLRENMKELVELFKSEDFSKELIKSINDDVDIPEGEIDPSDLIGDGSGDNGPGVGKEMKLRITNPDDFGIGPVPDFGNPNRNILRDVLQIH